MRARHGTVQFPGGRSLMYSTAPHGKEEDMDETAEKLLDSFAVLANMSHLHHEDWRRFFEFTIYVYRSGLPVNGRNVSNRLFSHNFPEALAVRLSSDFENFCDLLALYQQRCS